MKKLLFVLALLMAASPAWAEGKIVREYAGPVIANAGGYSIRAYAIPELKGIRLWMYLLGSDSFNVNVNMTQFEAHALLLAIEDSKKLDEVSDDGADKYIYTSKISDSLTFAYHMDKSVSSGGKKIFLSGDLVQAHGSGGPNGNTISINKEALDGIAKSIEKALKLPDKKLKPVD